MMQSINAFFNRRAGPQPATTPPPTRNSSEYTARTANAIVVSTDGANDRREKKNAITTVDSQNDSPQPSSPDPEKEANTYEGKKDPFAGGFEGGVTYKSMNWW